MLHFDARMLTYETFRNECLIPNRPAIISHAAADFFHPPSFTAPIRTEVNTQGTETSRNGNQEKYGKEEIKGADQKETEREQEVAALTAMRNDLSPEELWKWMGPDAMVPVYRSTQERCGAAVVSSSSSSQPDENGAPSRISLSCEACQLLSLREVFQDWVMEKCASSCGVDHRIAPHPKPNGKKRREEEEVALGKKKGERGDTHYAGLPPQVTEASIAREDAFSSTTDDSSGMIFHPMASTAMDHSTVTSFPVLPSPTRTYLKDFHYQQWIEEKCLAHHRKGEVHLTTKRRVPEEEEADAVGWPSSFPSSLPPTAMSGTNTTTHVTRRLDSSDSGVSATSQPCWCSAVPHYLGKDWLNDFCKSAASRDHGNTRHRRKPFSKAEHEDERDKPASTVTDEAGRGALSPSPPPPAPSFFFGLGNGESDYRFAYIGPPNTATPLHFDVFGSYSWSLNVCGCKLWYFPTAQTNAHLLSLFRSHSPPACPPDIRVLSESEPLWCVVQHPGDLVFVPALYLHQVHNIAGETFTISLPIPRSRGEIVAGSPSSLETLEKGEEEWEVGMVELIISINRNWCNQYNMERMITEVFLAQDVRYLVLHSSFSEIEMMVELININRPHPVAEETICKSRGRADAIDPPQEDGITHVQKGYQPSKEKNDLEEKKKEDALSTMSQFSLCVDIVLQHGANWCFRGLEAFLHFTLEQLQEERHTIEQKKRSGRERPMSSSGEEEGKREDPLFSRPLAFSSTSSFRPQNTDDDRQKIDEDRIQELASAEGLVHHLLGRLRKAWKETLQQLSRTK